MRASRVIVEELIRHGVRDVYEMCGGMTTFILDALQERRDEIRVVSVHHEQAAGFAAEAGARMTGIPGCAMATSGPGATNLLTAIGSCYFDSVPVVFITGQVNRNELRGSRPVRQVGFQETDIVSMVRGITKDALLVDDPDAMADVIADAFALACADRPGPVLLDIPMDVQRAEVAGPVLPRPAKVPLAPSADIVAHVSEAVLSAERPIMLVGGGARISGAQGLVRDLAHELDIPVANSLLGADVMSADDPLRVGLIGTYGNRWANIALGRADLVLVIGSRLDVRQTGADVAGFAAGKRIIQVDIDAAEIGGRVPLDSAVHADAAAFCRMLLDVARMGPAKRRPRWVGEVRSMVAEFPDEAELSDIGGINPARLMHDLSREASMASAFVADVGQNQMWAAQSLRLREGQRFLTSGGMGAMGFAFPAALGATIAVPGRPVVVISGDGGFQVNIQELETVVRLGLPVKSVVLDNRSLGMVRQFQDELFEGRHQSTVWGYGAPDFVGVAKAYGMSSRSISDESEVMDAVAWLMSDPTAPALLHVRLSDDTRVCPKVTFGSSIYRMEPPPTTGHRG
jgi:acetolactate synthase-1/2/3 large subunit